ncbi:hypothetical protein, partial [Rhodovulum visakhapatnamense]|uniref:hypothetical protein n=1 Tax=Rhodovulum visakhapatnamense TaxID=364297 RepID=UPI001AB0540B
FDAFMRFRSSPSQERLAENSSFKRSSFQGTEHTLYEDYPAQHPSVIDPGRPAGVREFGGSENSPGDCFPDKRTQPRHLRFCQPEKLAHDPSRNRKMESRGEPALKRINVS